MLLFLRCFAFNELNPLKRNYSNLQLASLIFTYTIIFICFLSSTNVFSYLCGIIGGTLLILNLITNPPLKNPILNNIYTFSVCFYTIISIVICLWTYTSIMDSNEVIFILFLLSTLLYFGVHHWM